MIELINNLSPYAPLVICVASFLDIFFATGLILYGAAMMGSIAFMYSNGMISFEAIVLATFSGTTLGNTVNYFVGRRFSEVALVSKRLDHPKMRSFANLLNDRGLLVFIIVCRFIAVVRPLYAILIGSLKISFHRFILYESAVAVVWVLFWLFIIIKGEQLFSYLLK